MSVQRDPLYAETVLRFRDHAEDKVRIDVGSGYIDVWTTSSCFCRIERADLEVLLREIKERVAGANT